MKLSNIYSHNIFNDGKGDKLSDYVLRLKADKKPTIRINVEELLMMLPTNEIMVNNGKVKMSMIDLWSIRIEDYESIVYEGFHEMRESVRTYMKKQGLKYQLEKINKKLFKQELLYYMVTKANAWEGFSQYFRERFPEEVKKRFSYNIGYMFKTYQNEFDKDYVPKEEHRYYKTEFRTRHRDYNDSYVYPIKITHIKMEATYFAKATICTYYAMAEV